LPCSLILICLLIHCYQVSVAGTIKRKFRARFVANYGYFGCRLTWRIINTSLRQQPAEPNSEK